MEVTDLLSYLVLETSFYPRFKAYKSLEAYNFMMLGFITSVHGCVVCEKYIVTGKVRHSQRMNDKDGTVNLVHCLRCKAGIAESCSHVARSVLF